MLSGATAYVLTQLQSDKAGVAWGERIESSSVLRGFFTASAVGGALLGTMVVLQVEGSMGRRRELLLAALLYMVGGGFEFASSFLSSDAGLVVCLLGRWVYGGGIAFAMHAAPAYLAEMSPPGIRGFMVALKEGMIVLGILLSQVAGFVFKDMEGGWRWPFFMSIPLGAAMGLGMSRLPSSARWLALQGRLEEAENSLRFFMKGGVGLAMEEIKASMQNEEEWTEADSAGGDGMDGDARVLGDGGGMRGSGGDKSEGAKSTHHSLVFDGGEGTKDAWKGKKRKKTTVLQVLRNSRYRRPLIVGLGVVTFQQVSGQPSVLYFSNEILRDFGLADSATLLVGVFKLVATMGAVLTVDRRGRRTLLLLGIGVMVLALALLSAMFAVEKEPGAKGQALDGVLIAAMFLYIAGYQVGFGPVSWILVSEIYPTEVRGETVGLAVMANFGSNLLVTFAFDPVRESIGTSATFGLFLGVAMAAWLFVYMLLPETKGLALEMIGAQFQSFASTSRWGSGMVGTEGLLSWFHRHVLQGPNTQHGGQQQLAQPQNTPARPAKTLGTRSSVTQTFIEQLLPVEKQQDGVASMGLSDASGTTATSAKHHLLAPPSLARYGVGRMEEKATTAPMGEESKVESVDLGEGEV